MFVYSGAKSADKMIVKLPFNSDPFADKTTKSNIKKQSAKLYDSIASKKTSVINKFVHFFVFNFGIKPFVLKKGNLYNGVLEHWKKRNISF